MSQTIVDILNEKGIQYEKRNNSLFIKCLFHDERTPSLSISPQKNVFKCFGCGKSGTLDVLLEKLGLPSLVHEFDNVSLAKDFLLKAITNQLVATMGKLPKDLKLLDFAYRGLTKEIIEEFQVFTSKEFPGRVNVPLYKDGVLYAILSRALDDDLEPRWLVTHYSKHLYPFPINKITSPVVFVVEGLFDLFNMWKHGYVNTICAISTSNVYITAKTLKSMGVKKVFVLFDGDKAGILAAEKLERALDPYMQVEVLYLPEGQDPASMGSDLKPFLDKQLQLQ